MRLPRTTLTCSTKPEPKLTICVCCGESGPGTATGIGTGVGRGLPRTRAIGSTSISTAPSLGSYSGSIPLALPTNTQNGTYYIGAIADYNQAIKINPNLAQVYNNRGFTRAELGDKQAAIAQLYHNPLITPTGEPTLGTFVEWHRKWNESLGIWELDREMKALQQTLSDVQERIIQGETFEVPVKQ